MELLYFALANVILFAFGIAIVWTVLRAVARDGSSTFAERLGEGVVEHLHILLGLPVILIASYFIYKLLVPDTYECVLTDGATVRADFDPERAWIVVGENRVPVSRIEECRALVVTLSQRVERAFGEAEKQQ